MKGRAAGFEIQGEWQQLPDGGFRYVAHAVRADFVLAKASARVALGIAHDRALYFGNEALSAVEQSINAACRVLAQGVAQ